MRIRFQIRAAALFALTSAILAGAGCRKTDPNRVQGYIEGEFVYVASPLGGAIEKLHCRRGDEVKAGAPLFVLDSVREHAAEQEAQRRLAQARASLEDLKKGRRTTEVEAIDAQLQQARAAFSLSEKDLARAQDLVRTRVATPQEFDRAQALNDQNKQRVAQLEADLQTAKLGARPDQIAAAEENVRATQAALDRTVWDLGQKTQAAPTNAIVFDTLFREGEWVAAGRPAVVLLPPANIKVRGFVPEPRVGSLHVGDAVRILVDGLAQPLSARISFISPRVEFTPPVIYSRELRSKLVVMFEAIFESGAGATLHPGQPVDIQL